MKKHTQIYAVLLLLVFTVSCKGKKETGRATDPIKQANQTEAVWPLNTKTVSTSSSPSTITRNIIQDKNGIFWIATFEGVYRYDGESFTNITSKVSSARFFSVLEDRKGDLWFGSIGSGVYRYDGESFQNFTTDEGLVNNEIGSIYEDKNGNIWFGANGGASRYDGKSFRNFLLAGGSIMEDTTGKIVPNLQRPSNEITSIVEDKTGKVWFGTRGKAFVYDGKTFTALSHNGKSFTNVRSILEDKKGDIWLGGPGGLWRYDGSIFSNFSQNFVGYIYEDKNGNIWTASQRTKDMRWVLSRYDEKALSNKEPTEIESKHEHNKGMIFGILEASDGGIWFGGLDGVHRYDGNTIEDF